MLNYLTMKEKVVEEKARWGWEGEGGLGRRVIGETKMKF